MALIERYFAVSASGSGDGSSVANAAALFDGSGKWSSVITGFDFTSNGLRCRIMPGAYTCAQSLAAAVMTDPDPSVPNPLLLHGADGDGDLLTPPDPNWQSCQPGWDTAAGWTSANWPVIATSSNIYTVALANCYMRMLKFTASGRTSAGGIFGLLAGIDWCSLDNSTADTDTSALYVSSSPISNSVIKCSGSSYSSVATVGNAEMLENVQIAGGGVSGDRRGIAFSGTTTVTVFSRIAIIGNGGPGWVYIGSNAGVNVRFWRCTIANNGGSGILFPDTAAQTARSHIDSCLITHNGAYGIDPGGANTNLVVTNSRIPSGATSGQGNNTSGSFGTMGNYPTDLGNSLGDMAANPYVDSANGDYRIKAGAVEWGKGYGVADEAEPTLPPVASVWSESDPYGYASGQLSGTMQWDDIANLTPANVRAGVVIGNENFTGELVLPTEAQVESGVEYGAAAEFVGELAAGGGAIIVPGLGQLGVGVL